MNKHKEKKILSCIMKTTLENFDKDMYESTLKNSPSIFNPSLNFISDYRTKITHDDITALNMCTYFRT